ncbi:DGQHR domain-containing protein [Heliobacillus mobilis]|uniref:DGQHR domain-containing protein n=1 Tax=Heliobacterium mobile TaxID=28064 RepID=A0A6I3SQ63_HELMO|nr:DNA sulfur modification protein DndB [Heliobacterium mobile]MTV50835.1 DGQHR domain-containing protein [Heliobacterium mobile]
MSSFGAIMVSFPGAAHRQFGKQIYTTLIPFGVMERFLMVDDDVQRKLNKRRVKSIANYILMGIKDGNLCFLSAITATCRGPIQYNEATNQLSIDISTQMSVNDGQHRFAGVKMALDTMRRKVDTSQGQQRLEYSEKLKKLEDMAIPVVIFGNLTKVMEQQLFHDLNLLANKPTKSVSLKFDNSDLYNAMAKELKNENEWLIRFGIETERTSLSERNRELMVLSTLRNMISFIISGTDKDSNAVLTLENYNTWKTDVSELIDKLFSVLPEDCNDRSRYIIGLAATIQGIGKYINYLINKENLSDEKLSGLKKVDWKHTNPHWNGAGGTFDPVKERIVFGGTGGGVNGIYMKLIEINGPSI